MHGVVVRLPTCSSSRIYMHHALGCVDYLSSVMERETRLPFRVFSIIRQGTAVWLHLVCMSLGRRYRSLHGGTSHQLDLISYGSRHKFLFLFFHTRDHGTRIHVCHGYILILFLGCRSSPSCHDQGHDLIFLSSLIGDHAWCGCKATCMFKLEDMYGSFIRGADH